MLKWIFAGKREPAHTHPHKRNEKKQPNKFERFIKIAGVVIPLLGLLVTAISVFCKEKPEPPVEPIDCNDSRYFIDLSRIPLNPQDIPSISNPLKYLENARNKKDVYGMIEACKAIVKNPYLGLSENDIQRYAEQGYDLAVSCELWREILFFGKYMNIYWKDNPRFIDIHGKKSFEIGMACFALGNIDFAIRCWNTYLLMDGLNQNHSSESLTTLDLKGRYFWMVNDYVSSLECFKELYRRRMEETGGGAPLEDKLKILWDNDAFVYLARNYGKLKQENEGTLFINSVFDRENHKIENYYLMSIMYSFIDHEKSMDYYNIVKGLENPDGYDIEFLYWGSMENVTTRNIGKNIAYFNKKYRDDEVSKNANIALIYAKTGKFSHTKQYFQKAINAGAPNNVLLWLMICKYVYLGDFRKTRYFNELIIKNKPVMKITDYGGDTEFDIFLEFLRE